jgi:hypothetical protein
VIRSKETEGNNEEEFIYEFSGISSFGETQAIENFPVYWREGETDLTYNAEVIGVDNYGASLKITGFIDYAPVYSYYAFVYRALTIGGTILHDVGIQIQSPQPCARLQSVVTKFKEHQPTEGCPDCDGWMESAKVEITWEYLNNGAFSTEIIDVDIGTKITGATFAPFFFTPLGDQEIIIVEEMLEKSFANKCISRLIKEDYDLQLRTTNPECLCLWSSWGNVNITLSTFGTD